MEKNFKKWFRNKMNNAKSNLSCKIDNNVDDIVTKWNARQSLQI